jgi:L,D-transpeptidase ErfK/SrfK
MRFLLILAAVLTVIGVPAAWAAYDKPYVGDMINYRATYEDTFVYIARDYKLGYVEMRAANPGVDPWIPGSGTRLVLPTRHLLPDAPHKGLVMNLPEMRMYYYRDVNEPPVTYPIGIGREGLDTPLGVTTVVRKTAGPTWTPTPRMRREDPKLPPVVPPGPDNPMGTHALYLGFPQVAIHGTNRAFGIGRRISSGCIRLYPEDIISLYNMVPVGTQVYVVNQPIKLAWIDDKLFMEAHPEVENAIALEETGTMPAPKLTQADMERIIKAAGPYKDRLHWATIRTAVKERRGYPVAIARRSGNVAMDAEQAGPKMTKIELKQAAAEALVKVNDGMESSAGAAADYGQEKRSFNP